MRLRPRPHWNGCSRLPNNSARHCIWPPFPSRPRRSLQVGCDRRPTPSCSRMAGDTRNHAPADQKKAEFGSHRPPDAMLDEIAAGRQRLDDLFGKQALPVFTPPWNRIAPGIVEALPAMGFAVVSTFTPRERRNSPPMACFRSTPISIRWPGSPAEVCWILPCSTLNSPENLKPAGLAARTMKSLMGC